VEAIDPLSFNEEQTRRYLIDLMLADVSWEVGADLTSTPQVKKEVKVSGQPTDSGIGYADYVLVDDNDKPLGVIEAKKTSKHAQDGRTQAKCYADGLEAEHGQRPIIFYTSGYDLWIWNDAAGEPPRKIYGYYSKDSLQRLHFQRKERKPAAQVGPDKGKCIITRMYQFEAVRRVVEHFAQKKRKALIVQATGTGKTRVAIALCDALIQAHRAKRVLFLCDRRELRKQAHNAFKEFLPSENRTYVTSDTANDRTKRIYLATYPAMMKVFETFDPGFFDLIIADESHRSLYNRYRQLFNYFDCYQVGLTATPIDYIAKSTFDMFQCGAKDPTFNYSYEEAINSNPPYLVPFVVDMCRLKGMLSDFFGQLNQSLGIKAGTAAEANRGHVKGFVFEEDLYGVFAEMGNQLGDEIELVRGAVGALSRCKKGDYVSTLGDACGAHGQRIVVEVKDQPIRLKAAIDELQEAKKNREAVCGIFAFARGAEPAEVGDFRRIGEDFYVTVDKEDLGDGKPLMFLDCAYKIARALAVAATRKEEAGELDTQLIRDQLDALTAWSDRIADMATKARTIQNSGKLIAEIATELKADLDLRVAAVLTALRAVQ
jgi:hypothetical protein